MHTRCNCEAECCSHQPGSCPNRPHSQIEAFGIKVTLCEACLHTWQRHTVIATPESSPRVVRQFYDDWLLWTIYSDGSVRQAMTECWPEHGCEFTADGSGPTNWPAVMAAVRDEHDPRFAGDLLRFALEVPEVSREQFLELLDAWSRRLPDGDMGYA